MRYFFILFFLIQSNFLFSQINLKVNFVAHDKPLVLDSLCYQNALNQRFMIADCKFFLSDVIINNKILVDTCHFFDLRDSSSHCWKIDIKPKKIENLSFTFGIDNDKHKSIKLKNPVHSLMFWPVVLGSGYHYCKVDIRFWDKFDFLANFNCHLGPGVKAMQLNFENLQSKKEIQIDFDVYKFLCYNQLYDFSTSYGIMDKVEIMQIFIDNLKECFIVK